MNTEPLKILALDPAMANMGWVLGTFDPSVVQEEPAPSWVEDTSGIHTYRCFTRLDGGTFSTDNKQMTVNERLIHQIDEVHLLCAIHKPEMIAMESQLEVGSARCTWGVALQFGIMFPYFCMHQRGVRLVRCPDDSWMDGHNGNGDTFTHFDHIPNYGVAIKPPQLQSIVHHEQHTKIKHVKERYKEVSGDTRKSVQDHEADAYFIAIHSGRFWATCLNPCWGEEFLSKKEKRVFLDEEKGMVNKKGESWWINFS